MKNVIIAGILGIASLGMMVSCSEDEPSDVYQTYDPELGYDTPLDTKSAPALMERDSLVLDAGASTQK